MRDAANLGEKMNTIHHLNDGFFSSTLAESFLENIFDHWSIILFPWPSRRANFKHCGGSRALKSDLFSAVR